MEAEGAREIQQEKQKHVNETAEDFEGGMGERLGLGLEFLKPASCPSPPSDKRPRCFQAKEMQKDSRSAEGGACVPE